MVFKISWRDLSISIVLVVLFYLLLLLFFPYKYALICNSTGECEIKAIEGIPFFNFFTYLIPVLAGLVFYFLKNKLDLLTGLAILTILFIIRAAMLVVLTSF